ncbi:50S ribosomal protein L25 [Patescibacteria group bacterium]|nr:50S ribosomal protein L25 [Patescibacteria group bacterium]MBU1703014.1 50S ribosomal protein L25 [Patescibacteria group bacterium]MBU1954046.1 50S ribosomal protein L25 [Patescibacteria group bacterium]
METVKLDVQSRDVQTSVRDLRKSRVIPAVCYGQGEMSSLIKMDYQTFRRAYMKAGTSQLIDLSVDGKTPKKVLVHEMQHNSLSGAIEHVDFLMVNLKEAITAHIPVEIIGEAPAIKDFGGILNVVRDEITVKCLPLNLPAHINVDISGLNELSSAIHIENLQILEGVEFMDNPDDVVVIVNAPAKEEEIVAAPEEAIAEGAEAGEAAKVEDQAEEPAKEEKSD